MAATLGYESTLSGPGLSALGLPFFSTHKGSGSQVLIPNDCLKVVLRRKFSCLDWNPFSELLSPLWRFRSSLRSEAWWSCWIS